MSLGSSIAEEESALRRGTASTEQAECVGLDWEAGLAIVNLGGAEIGIPMVGEAPWPQDRVWVARMGTIRVCLGSVARSAQGTVVSIAGSIATVAGDDGSTYTYPISEDFSSGQRVRLDHSARLVTARYLAEPPGSTFVTLPPVAPAPSAIREQWFNPVESGNYRNGSFSGGLVEISDNRTGVYWYDRQIEGTIPDGAEILEARISLREEWDQVPGTASRLGTHSQARPSGPPALSGAVDVYGGGDHDIRAFADALKTGAALGVGFAAGAGWRAFGSASVSGAIFMKWRV